MKRVAGVAFLLVVLYAVLLNSNPGAARQSNLYNVANLQGFYGIMTLGVAMLIITGGIDLSMGSVIGYSAVAFGVLMENGTHPNVALGLTLLIGVKVGLINGLLVTQFKLQAFLVTLCGLFVYRGIARQISSQSVGLEKIKKAHPEYRESLDFLRKTLIGEDPENGLQFPMVMVVCLVLALFVGIVLHATVYGRYWYAIGYNEQAARYAGVNANRHRLVVFVLCSVIASFCGVLWLLTFSDANPETAGASYELYAITGAVLGGCSLRGGEGSAVGMVLGAAVLPVLYNLVIFLGIRDAIVPSVIGLTLLFGVIVDEAIRRGTFKGLVDLFRKS